MVKANSKQENLEEKEIIEEKKIENIEVEHIVEEDKETVETPIKDNKVKVLFLVNAKYCDDLIKIDDTYFLDEEEANSFEESGLVKIL